MYLSQKTTNTALVIRHECILNTTLMTAQISKCVSTSRVELVCEQQLQTFKTIHAVKN